MADVPVAVEAELARLRAENARLLRLLKLTPHQAAPPGPAQAAYFEAPPGLVDDGSAPQEKVAFYAALFAARTDVYADRTAALARLQRQPGGPPLLAVATGPYAGEGFDCPVLDTLFLAAPIAQKGLLVQYAGRILRPYDGKTTAEVHDYHDELTGVLASSLAKRAPGYTALGFPDPRKLPYTPSAQPAEPKHERTA